MQSGNLIQIKKSFKYIVKEKVYPKGDQPSATEFFIAVESATGRVVGIKRIKCDQKSYNSYKSEIAVIMGLEPYVSDIPTIYCYDYTDGILTVVMQYFKGDTLLECMEREKGSLDDPMVVRKNLKRLQMLASILGDVHQRRVQHKDLKPQNIIIQPSSAGESVKLIDFGLSASVVLKGTGTPGYQSPEQCELYKGVADVSRIDVFAFGLIMYEVLCGKKLRFGMELIADVNSNKWRNIPDMDNPNVPKTLNAVLKKCLAFNPKERYANGGEIAWQIKKIISQRQ